LACLRSHQQASAAINTIMTVTSSAAAQRARGGADCGELAGQPQDSGMTENPEPVTVVVADDQSAVREGLVLLLGTLPGIAVVGQAADGEAAVETLAAASPQAVLMDLNMPRCDGVEATRRIRADHPGTRVVVLTTYSDDESIIGALQAGALGYLTKDATRAEIGRAVQAAAAGQAVVDPEVQERLLSAAGCERGWPMPRPAAGGPGVKRPGSDPRCWKPARSTPRGAGRRAPCGISARMWSRCCGPSSGR
jgi:DNA-binding NarL/FixJ family response regulator